MSRLLINYFAGTTTNEFKFTQSVELTKFLLFGGNSGGIAVIRLMQKLGHRFVFGTEFVFGALSGEFLAGDA